MDKDMIIMITIAFTVIGGLSGLFFTGYHYMKIKPENEHKHDPMVITMILSGCAFGVLWWLVIPLIILGVFFVYLEKLLMKLLKYIKYRKKG